MVPGFFCVRKSFKAINLKKEDCILDKFDKCFKYYEKAIEGRNFHYQNYNTWVNYYSIFNGALFVGYYSLLQKETSILLALIALLGFISAICWHSTVKGHYIWMISWINIVHNYEEELNKIIDEINNKPNNASEKIEKYNVYSVYTRPKKEFHMKNISTQKMTSTFTFIVCIAWGILLGHSLFYLFGRITFFNNLTVMKIFISSSLVLVAFFLSKAIFDKESDTSQMKQKIKE